MFSQLNLNKRGKKTNKDLRNGLDEQDVMVDWSGDQDQERMVRPMEGRLRSPCSDPSGHFLLIAFIWPNKYFHISLPNLIHSFLLNDERLAFRCHVSSDLFLYCSLFTSFYLLPTVWCGLNGRKKMTPLSSKTSRRRTRSVFWEESS